jgi:26S proteasome regulatory subunit N7
LTIVRLGFSFSDTDIVTTNTDKAEKCVVSPAVFLANLPLHRLIDEGGDWDCRNRLKVYTGLHFLSIRQFKRGGELLLEVLRTFIATELPGYNKFVGLTVIANHWV